MAMVTAMVMAMGDDGRNRRSHRLSRQLPGISIRRGPLISPAPPPRHACAVALGCLALAAPAHAENWRITPSASLTETYTSNVNYSAASNAQGDFATTVTGALAINGQGARVRLNGTIAATGLFYVKETQNNSFAPSVNLTGTVEAIEKFLYIDGTALVTQTFASPFGPQPGNLVNATANRYTQQTYNLSPYIVGHIPGTNITYRVRDDNIWTLSSNYGNNSLDPPGTYFNQLNANIGSPPAPWGWTGEYIRTHYAPTDKQTFGSYTIQLARVIATYQYDPSLQASLRGGYEKDEFPLTSSDGIIYGAGLQWSPSDRTQVGGYWEHRFFGSSYSAQFSHRLPRTALAISFARGLNTYPQNALTIPAGANVPAFLDAAFATRIPDPAERALAVQQFLAQSNLPATLATPVNVFAATVQLQTTATATAVLLGLRNSLAFSLYYTKSTAISGTGQSLPDALQLGQNNTQTGGGVSFSHKISGLTSLTASGTFSRTTSNDSRGAFAGADSNNWYASAGLVTALGPKTSASFGANYTRFIPTGIVETNTTSSYSVYAGISHVF